MKPLLLARFTPSLTAPEDLEAIFVQREPLAERLLSQLHDSLTTANKHHTLLVGPRGIGKTHLLTLVRHRLINRPDLRALCIVAWLREDEWGIMSFLDLLLRVLRALSDGQEAEIPADRLDALHDLPPAQAEKAAGKLLLETIGNKTLVLLVENLDDIFRGLEQREQAAFRAFLQEHACVTTLATTPGLFDGISRRQSPFFGFFRIQHLEELTFADAAELLHKIAARRGQDDLASFILTPTGRARIRAIHHLAQGNPRVYVILSEFLTRQSLDDLVDPVLRMLDDLTPYYQSRLAWLSNQQRKLVEFLASHRIPCTVKELARRCFITAQTTSGQLRKLAEWGYVRFETEGRESYYELREPLMRFCLDLKKERKEPLRPLVEILRIWWTPDELQLQLQLLDTDISPTAKYLAKALDVCRQESDDPRSKACRKDFHKLLEAEQFEKALVVAEDWVAVCKDGESLFQLGYTNLMLKRFSAAWEALICASELDPNDFAIHAFLQIVAYNKGDFKESINHANMALAINHAKKPFAAMHSSVVGIKALALCKLEAYEESIACFDEVLNNKPTTSLRAKTARLKAESQLMLGRFQEAESTLIGASQAGADSDYYNCLAVAQYRLKRNAEALASLDQAIALGESVKAHLTKAKIFAEESRWAEVMPEIEKSLTISSDTVREWMPTLRGIALLAVLNPERGFRDFLANLNRNLQVQSLPTIRIVDLMTLAAKEINSGESSAQLERFSLFFKKLAEMGENEHVLTLVEVFFDYARNHDDAVFRRLPLEERQLLQSLKEDLTALRDKKPEENIKLPLEN